MSEKSPERKEFLALSSPLFVRIVGVIVIAVISWVGKTTYENSLALQNFQPSVNQLTETLKEIKDTNTKLDIRISNLETSYNRLGGPNDPNYANIQNLNAQISDIKSNLAVLQSLINNYQQIIIKYITDNKEKAPN